jgi:Tfp pilus assembly protein PilX
MNRTRTFHREHGSAYVIALLVLVVLTLLGLSLALVSSTEQQVGFNERMIQRTFYAADAGIGLMAAKILVNNDFRAGIPGDEENGEYVLNAGPGPLSTLVRNRVTLSPAIPLVEAPCTLCEINNAGSYRENAFVRINVAVTTLGERVSTDGSQVLATNLIAANLDIQPRRASPPIAYEALARLTPEELAEQIKF